MKKKTIIVGLVIGAVLSVVGSFGMAVCRWNPVEGSVVRDGLCREVILQAIFYLPIIPQSILVLLTEGSILGYVLMSLVTIIEFVLLSLLVSWIYRKIILKGKK